MGGYSGRCSAAAGPLLWGSCCLEARCFTTCQEAVSLSNHCRRLEYIAQEAQAEPKVTGMTRGNQRDLAREKNLKKQQVLAHAQCHCSAMIGVVSL
jgi:hypothetical protein